MRSMTLGWVVIGLLMATLCAGCGGSSGGGSGGATAPILTAVTPQQGPETGNTLLTLTGTNFVAGATITVGGSAAGNVTAVDSTQCTCRTPPGTAGSAVAVAITTTAGTATLPAAFTYVPSNLGIVRARVRDTSGTRLADVTMAVAGKTALTDAQGNARIPDVAAGPDQPVDFTAAGYVSTARRITVLANEELTFEVMMAPVGTTQTVDTTAPFVVTHAGGGVSVPADGVVDALGTLVTTAVAQVTTLAPSASNYGAFFPGPFLGLAASDGSVDPILSYGVVDITLSDTSGNALQLATGVAAVVEIPIDPAADPGSAAIPLWYYDAAQALWVEEGTATRDAGKGVYRASVTHLTPWNLDEPLKDPAYKRVTVLDSDGKPVVAAWVSAATDVPSVLWSVTVTDENGQAKLPVPANSLIRVWAQKGNVRSADIFEISPGAGLTLDNWITLDPAQIIITLTWNAVPGDLDLHVTAPTTPVRTHIYRTSQGSMTELPYLELEANDEDGFGPETISVMRVLPGTYRCCVHNYSGQSDTLGLCNSGAQIRLEIAGDPDSPRFFVPPPHDAQHLDNNVWVTFDLTMTASGSIWLLTHNTWGTTDSYHP